MDSEVISQCLGHPHSYQNNKTTHQKDWPVIESKEIPIINERRSSVIELTSYPDHYNYSFDEDLVPNIKPTVSYSTPSISEQSNKQRIMDPTERISFLREMEQAREELAEFRRNMAGLVQQMDGISIDLEKSKDRVSEIEQDLTATEEVNVNLQVLLERAVKTQKESDIFATQAIRNIYSDLASVVCENNQLHSRLASIESHQKEQEGSVHDIVKRMLEYTQMLEQAQGTIHMLQEPRLVKLASIASSSTATSRRTSLVSFYDDDENASVVSSATIKETHYNNRKASSSSSVNYIQSPPLGPQSTNSSMFKPQQGLRMLFDNHAGSSVGLGSLAPPPSPPQQRKIN